MQIDLRLIAVNNPTGICEKEALSLQAGSIRLFSFTLDTIVSAMRSFTLFLLLSIFSIALSAQVTQAEVSQMMSQPKPSYCFAPVQATARSAPASAATPFPEYPSLASICYKVQVAILREKDPTTYAFHPSLTARWRPCEEVWVVETKETYCNKNEAESAKGRLKELGYPGAFLTKMVGYQ